MDDAVGNIVKAVVASTDTLVSWLQQMPVLVHHTEAKHTIHRDYEFR